MYYEKHMLGSMNVRVRNVVLCALLVMIQYQLWFSPYGLAMSQELQQELNTLDVRYLRMKKHIQQLAPSLTLPAREEILEDQAREVYHYVASDEIFIPFSVVLGDA